MITIGVCKKFYMIRADKESILMTSRPDLLRPCYLCCIVLDWFLQTNYFRDEFSSFNSSSSDHHHHGMGHNTLIITSNKTFFSNLTTLKSHICHRVMNTKCHLVSHYPGAMIRNLQLKNKLRN